MIHNLLEIFKKFSYLLIKKKLQFLLFEIFNNKLLRKKFFLVVNMSIFSIFLLNNFLKILKLSSFNLILDTFAAHFFKNNANQLPWKPFIPVINILNFYMDAPNLN